MRIGVIGAGHLGRIHARLLAGLEGVELVGVADPVPEARRAVAAENKIAETADFRELIPTDRRGHRRHADAIPSRRRDGIDRAWHSSAGRKADHFDRGRGGGTGLAARWHNVVLQVGHIERFNPALVPAARALARPRYIEAVRQGPYSFRSTDISVVLDLMIHDLDLALWLTGGIGARCLGRRLDGDGGQDDFAHARIEFADGCVANLTASRVSHRPRRQMQLWTADAQIEIDFNTRRSTIVETGGD